jgi:predicted hydrocarbon binding protein
MPAPDPILSPLGLDRLVDDRGLARDPATGNLAQGGTRIVGAPAGFLRSVRLVLEAEGRGVWAAVQKAAGVATGEALGVRLDTELTRMGQPTLSALPLEGCLALLERQLAAEGWGRIKLDLTDAAEHGLIVARLEHSGFAAALPEVADFVDPLVAGVLAGFFRHLSGAPLDCEEIACVRAGAPECVFVVTLQERIAAILPQRGQESAEALIARLKS